MIKPSKRLTIESLIAFLRLSYTTANNQWPGLDERCRVGQQLRAEFATRHQQGSTI